MNVKSAWGGLLVVSCLWACSPSSKVDLSPSSKSTSAESGEVDGSAADGEGDGGWIVLDMGDATVTCAQQGGTYTCPNDEVFPVCADFGDPTAGGEQVCIDSGTVCMGCFQGAGYGCICKSNVADAALDWSCVAHGYPCH